MEISYTYMTEEDIPQVAFMEAKYFSQPWSEDGLKKYLDSGKTLFVVAKHEGLPIGYLAVICILDEGNLVSIVVEEDYRERGIASELLDIAYEALKKQDVTNMYLEVRAGNKNALRLYKKEGFEQVGLRKDFYEKPKEDAILLHKEL